MSESKGVTTVDTTCPWVSKVWTTVDLTPPLTPTLTLALPSTSPLPLPLTLTLALPLHLTLTLTITKVWTTVDKHERADMTSVIHGKYALPLPLTSHQATMHRGHHDLLPSLPTYLRLTLLTYLRLTDFTRHAHEEAIAILPSLLTYLQRTYFARYAHEEAIATASMAETYLIIKNMAEAQEVASYILDEPNPVPNPNPRPNHSHNPNPNPCPQPGGLVHPRRGGMPDGRGVPG